MYIIPLLTILQHMGIFLHYNLLLHTPTIRIGKVIDMPSTKPNGKRMDRRVVRTRKAIMKAFDKLISEGGNSKITVSAIAREADIDRKTFYLHYKSVDDLANAKTEEALQHILDKLAAEGVGKTHLERVHIVLNEVNTAISANTPLYSSVAKSMSTDQVLERFGQAIIPALARAGFNPGHETNKQILARTQFFIAGSVFLYADWLRSDHSEPIESISNIIEESIGTMYAKWAQQNYVAKEKPSE